MKESEFVDRAYDALTRFRPVLPRQVFIDLWDRSGAAAGSGIHGGVIGALVNGLAAADVRVRREDRKELIRLLEHERFELRDRGYPAAHWDRVFAKARALRVEPWRPWRR